MPLDQSDDSEAESSYSPLQAAVEDTAPVSVSGREVASKLFGQLSGERSAQDDAEQHAFQEYEKRAQEARAVLANARSVLAARKLPNNRYLDIAAAFGTPTRTGSFGETLGNYARARSSSRAQETQAESARQQQLLGLDEGISNIDQQVALQGLKLQGLKRTANNALMGNTLKVLARPDPKAPGQIGSVNPGDYTGESMEAYKHSGDMGDLVRRYAPSLATQDFDPDHAKDVAKAIANYQLAPLSAYAMRTPYGQSVSAEVLKLNPEYQANEFGSRAKAYKDFMSGKKGDAIRAFNNSLLHLDTLDKLTGALNNGDTKLFNYLGNTFANQTGKPAPTNFESARDIVADEVVKAIIGTGGGVADRDKAQKAFNTANSPQALRGVFQTYKTLLGGQLLGLSHQYKSSTGRKDFEDQLDSDEARGIYNELLQAHPDRTRGGEVSPQATPQVAPEMRIEDLEPGHYAEGGQVGSDGRTKFQMPDGTIISAHAGDDYDHVLALYSQMLATKTQRGLDSQGSSQTNDFSPQPSMLAQAAPVAGAAALGAGAGAVAQGAANQLPGNRLSPAERQLSGVLQNKGLTVADLAAGVQANQKLGVPAMAFDQGNPVMGQIANNALGVSGGPNATEVLSRLRARAAQAPIRTANAINQGLKPDDYLVREQELLKDLYSQSKPLYDKAFQSFPQVQSKVIPRILGTPDGQAAVKNALRLMHNDSVAGGGKGLTPESAQKLVENPSLEFLDKVKQGFDQSVIQEEGSGLNYKATPLGRSMRNLRTKLVGELDNLTSQGGKVTSPYQAARQQYEGDLGVVDALRSGREDFLKVAPDRFRDQVGKMSFAERDALRTGVAQNLSDMLAKSSGDTNSAKKLIGNPAIKQKLAVLFDNPRDLNIFQTALQRESELYDNSRKSIAAAEVGQARAAQPQPGLLKRVATKIPFFGATSPTVWAAHALRTLPDPKADPGVADELLGHLKAATPDELQNLGKLGDKFTRAAGARGRLGRAATVGAVLGAGANLAKRVFSGSPDDAATTSP